jgi:hydrogenase nickel incorporation protein HypA/HybF
MNIIEIAEDEAERRGVRVEAIHVQVGPLTGVVKEALTGAFDIAIEGTALQGARLVVEEVPIVVNCPTCRVPRQIESMQWFCCPECNTPTSDVVQGAELQVTALEVEA